MTPSGSCNLSTPSSSLYATYRAHRVYTGPIFCLHTMREVM